MCVSLHRASFGLTGLAGWRVPSRKTHVMLYGNQPYNMTAQPNALILHIPVAPNTLLTRANFVPVDGLTRLFSDMWNAVQPERVSRGVQYKGLTRPSHVETFDLGRYTWVAATGADAGEIGDALAAVRPDRRPYIGEALIDFYRRTWPGDALAIGCFNQTDGTGTDAACIEFVPEDYDVMRLAATDAHGTIPVFGQPVDVNHRVVIGTDEFGIGSPVRYRETDRMHPRLQEIVPLRVIGAELTGARMPNGDFYADFRRAGSNRMTDGPVALERAHGPSLESGFTRIPIAA